jgi:hypothetical protein
VQGNTPASPYIDVDAPVDATDEELNLIIKTFQDVAIEINAPPDVIINRCDRQNKRSIHIIGDGYSLQNGMDIKRFSEKVKGRLPEHIQSYIDKAGGNKSYGLRIAGCCKNKDKTAILDGEFRFLQNNYKIIELKESDAPHRPWTIIGPVIENQIENPLLNQFVEDIKSKYPQYDIDQTDQNDEYQSKI